MSNRAGSAANSSAVDARADQRQREVADHLRRRRHLHQPAEHAVGGGVVRPRPPRTGPPARARWPAGAGSTAGRRGSRGDTPARSAQGQRRDSKGAYTFRSASQYGSSSQTAASDSPVSYSVCAAAATIARQRGLAGGARQRRARRRRRRRRPPATPPGRWPAVRRGCRGCARAPAGRSRLRSAVTRVAAAGGAQQPGHVLDRQHVRAGVDDLLGQLQVVVEGVEVLAGIGQVTGVAHRDFGDRRTGFAHRVDRRTHRLDVVERVEDAEDVDAGRGGLVDERLGDQLRVRACSRRCCARAAASAGRCWAPPRAVRPAAPTGPPSGTEAPHRKSRRPSIRSTTAAASSGRCRRATIEQAVGAHPRRQQRLMRVAERGVGDADGLGLAQPRRESLRAQLDQPLLATRRRRRRRGRSAGSLSCGYTVDGRGRAAG